jgi:sporulation protein YlmC with PRC-barrel domain
MINVYDYDKKNIENPDEEELIRRLRKFIPQKSFFNRQSNTDTFYDWIREIMRLSQTETVKLEHLIDYAKSENIEIPYLKKEVNVKIEKTPFPWSYVHKVGFTDLGKCVLLNEPIEAKIKGVEINKKVDYKSTDFLARRTVIDSDGKIIGSAVKFLIGSPPGLLIKIERLVKSEYVNIEALKNTLIPTMFRDNDQLTKQVKKDLGLREVTEKDLPNWANKNKINVPKETIERREATIDISVDWGEISRIGDVVLLKKPIEKLTDETALIKEKM